MQSPATILLLHLLLMLPVASFHSSAPAATFTLHFHHKVGGEDLRLFDGTYMDPFGEPFTITRFKYYISHLCVSGPGYRDRSLSDKVYLIDESDSASMTLVLPLPGAEWQSISFVIGVDSILNTSGVQTGDLDPLKGMFWTWNTGYIFARMEGRSDSSSAPAHYLNWDVGGYRSSANASRIITLTIPGQVKPVTGTALVIDADLEKWFNGRRSIRISQHPLCHQPGELAMQLADNYSCMFSVEP